MLTDRASATIVVSTVFPTLAAFAFGLRIYARRIKAHAFHLDDYICLVATVSLLMGSRICSLDLSNGP